MSEKAFDWATESEPVGDGDAGPAFDWASESEPVGMAAARPSQPSSYEAFGRGAVQGATLGFGDEASALLEALQRKLPDIPTTALVRSLAQLSVGRPLGEEIGGEGREVEDKGFADVYQEARNAMRAQNRAAQEAHPYVYGSGQLAGGLLTAPVTPGGSAKGLGQILKQGAAMGSIGGLGASEAETLPGVAEDVAMGAATGAGVAGLGHGLATAAKKLAPALKKFGIEQGRRVLGGGQAPLALSKPVSDAAVRQAMKSGAMPPGATVQEVAKNLAQQRQTVGRQLGNVLQELEQAGVQAPAAPNVMDELERRAYEAVRQGDTKRAAYLRQTADKIRRAEESGPAGVPQKLGLAEMENIKRTAQAEAKSDFARWRAVTPLQKARMEAAGVIQDSIEQAVEAQKQVAPVAAKRFVPLKERFGRVAQAEEEAHKGAIRADKRNRLSLRDIGIGAGSAAGAGAAFGPLGLLAGPALAFGSNLARTRGTSAIARGALGAGEALQRLGQGAVGRVLGGISGTLGRVAPGLVGMSTARASLHERLAGLMRNNQAMAQKYGAQYQQALERGSDALAAFDFVTSQRDPEYVAAREAP